MIELDTSDEDVGHQIEKAHATPGTSPPSLTHPSSSISPPPLLRIPQSESTPKRDSSKLLRSGSAYR